MRSTPRSWFSLFLAHHGWVAMMFSVGLLGLTALSVWHYQAGSVYARLSQPVTATVKAHKIDVSGNTRLRVQYKVGDRWYGTQLAVSQQFAARHPAGGPVVLYHLPGQPTQVQTHKINDRTNGIIYQLLAGLMGLGALGFGAYAGRIATDAIRTRTYGVRIPAQITRIAPITDRKGRKPTHGRVVFQDADGRFGTSMAHKLSTLAPLAAGDTIHVYHGPKRNWWEADIGPRPVGPSWLPTVPARQRE
jgi:hypothetical protein